MPWLTGFLIVNCPEGMTPFWSSSFATAPLYATLIFRVTGFGQEAQTIVNVKQQNTSRMKLLSRSFIAPDAAEPF